MSSPDDPIEGEADGSAFVARHAAAARALGERLADSITEPAAFETTLREGLAGLADPATAAALAVVSPSVSTEYAVRSPLLALVRRPVSHALRQASSATALWLAQRLVEADHRDVRLFALLPLRRALAPDPELTWQLLRRMGAGAGDWIEVDSLADPWARGILAEPFRWAELEQLVYSQRPGERRLVGATLATMPHRVPRVHRAALLGQASRKAFDLIGSLMGDAEPLVQKALAWAIREWTPIDPDAAAGFVRAEAASARANDDGARAWVVRESLSRQPADLATTVRLGLSGIRRRPDAASTSTAAAMATRFAELLPTDHDVVARQGERYARSRP